MHRVSSSLLGPIDPSFRALSGRLKFTVRRHKVNKVSFSWQARAKQQASTDPRLAVKTVREFKFEKGQQVSPTLGIQPRVCGPVSPYSGLDCVKSLWSSYTGLYPQTEAELEDHNLPEAET